MAERIVFYTNKSERDAAITFAESQGETMIHDDFGVGPSQENQLTFDVRTDVPDPAVVRLGELHAQLRGGPLTLPEISEMLRIERRLD